LLHLVGDLFEYSLDPESGGRKHFLHTVTATIYQLTRRYIPVELNHYQHYCKTLTFRTK